MEYIKKILSNQFIRYVIVGGTVTVLNIILLYILKQYTPLDYMISNILANFICLIITFVLSKKKVFTNKIKINMFYEFLIYIGIALAGLILDSTLMYIFVDKFNVYYILAKCFTLIFVVLFNFISKKYIYIKLDDTKEETI